MPFYQSSRKLNKPSGYLNVTVSLDTSGKYLASILTEIEGENPAVSTEGKVIGIDLGLTHFAITSDGSKVSKYDNPRYLTKHEKNLKRQQQKLAKKQKGSNSRNQAKKLVAKVYERVSKSRQDFLQHKLSRKLVNENQVVVVENLNVKGMVRNHNLAKAISDVGWGTFTNFLAYKLEIKGGKLVEIDRWFPSSKLCSNCDYQADKLPLDVREWTCPNCGTRHDRDGNAATNIRNEGIRMLQTDGTAVSEERRGSKTKAWTQVRSEAFPHDVRSPHYNRFDLVWVVHTC